jgi:aspartate/methionine/tyrosine aminotransferase
MPHTTHSTYPTLAISARAKALRASPIDEIVSRCNPGVIDLAIGLSALPPAVSLTSAGAEGQRYAPPEGSLALRKAIASEISRRRGFEVDADRELTITCGATEGLLASLLAVINPRDEVIAFEPYYDGYSSAVALAGGRLRCVRLNQPDWTFDKTELSAAFSDRTKALIINSPHNPTGKVFSSSELQYIVAACEDRSVTCISDEVYERMLYDGRDHASLLDFSTGKNQVIVLNSMSKTYHAAGWRIGYAIAPPLLTNAIRVMHSSISYSAPAPLQECGVSAYRLPSDYYLRLAVDLKRRRDHLASTLTAAGLPVSIPEAGMFLLADTSGTRFKSDLDLTDYLLTSPGVAAVPARSFYGDHDPVTNLVRFCFARSDATLDTVRKRLKVPTDD